ncbi:MAG: DUF4340 domain-containing protein [Ruminococcaceae bacterium]|nr:DUF4340 domain-containing protein [Oscillospiraceae bacterium]
MKPWVKILILVAALAVCVAGCFIVVDIVKNNDDTPEIDTDTVIVGGFDNDIQSITYTYQGNTAEFKLVNYSWVNPADEEMPLRQEDLDDLAKLLRDGAKSVRMVDDTGSLVKSEGFGLDQPALSIRASDGTVAKTVYIGDFNSAFDAYYANIEGSAEVHLIAADIPEAFMKDIFALAVEAEAYPEISYEDVIRISLFDGADRREMAYSEGGSEELYSDYYTWFEQDASGEYNALRTSAMTVLCEELVSFDEIACVAYASDGETLAAYGLDKDFRGFKIGYIGEIDVENDVGVETQEAELELEVKFSRADGEGNCYMIWEGNPTVYRVSAEKADAVMGALTADLTPDEVCAISLDSVESFNVVYNGAEINVVRTQSTIAGTNGAEATVTNIFTANGMVVDATSVNNFYDGLLALTVEGRAEAGTWEDGAEPHMTVTFSRNTENFTEMTLYVYEYNVNFYRISFNGVDDMLVSIRDIDNMGDAILRTLK